MRPIRTLTLTLAAVFVAQLAAVPPSSATLRGGNGLIAFETGRSDELDIWRMTPEGTNFKRLTTSAKEDVMAAFGYAGIVFARHDIPEGQGDLFRMAFNGTGKTRLTRTPAINEADPVWSPTGDIPIRSMRILFSSPRTGNGDLYTVRASDGANLTRITFNRKADFEPDWGHQGIVFVSLRTCGGDLYFMKPNGTGLKRVTRDAALDTEPSLIPDGGRIVFVSDRDGDTEIFTIRLDGTGLKKLTTNGATDLGPVWAPECDTPSSFGCRIAFMSDRDKPSFEIYTMKPDGTDVRRLTHNDFLDGFPTWQPLAG